MAQTARQSFFKSPHHAALALGTLGVGFMAAAPLWLIIGAAAYVVGWVYLPDMGFFSRWREKKTAEANEKERQAELGEFAIQRDALVEKLTVSRRRRHENFTATSAQIAIGQDPRAGKLEEMRWTFLRLLGIEQSLEIFLEGERRDDVPALLIEAQEEMAALDEEMEEARKNGRAISSAREKLRDSRHSRHDVLLQRSLRITEAQDNAALASAEIERLEDQIKLIRAEAVTSSNAGGMSARISSTFEHLAQTNRWLGEMDRFRDQLGQIPEGGMGVRNPLATSNTDARQKHAPNKEGATDK